MKTISTAGGGGVVLPIMAYTGGGGGSAQEGYLFRLKEINIWKGKGFISLSIWKTTEICPFGL